MKGLMNIGAVAERSGISAKSIRYYESMGVIPEAKRTEGNYRAYDQNDVDMLKFVGRARHLGFGLNEIKMLLNLWNDPTRTNTDVRLLALKHVTTLKEQKRELESMLSILNDLINKCEQAEDPDCPILDDMAK